MIAPLLSYVTFNRKELVANSMYSILKSSDDFEMHIIDNNSTDGTWEYLQSVNDDRIKSKTRIDINYGPIYALNMNIVKRQKDQYVFNIDSTVVMNSCNWISRIVDVFEQHKRFGILGPMQNNIDPGTIEKFTVNSVDCYELKNIEQSIDSSYIPFECMAFSPKLLDTIGYFSEETYYGDKEICYRVMNFTNYKIGFVPFLDFVIQQNPPNLDSSLLEKLNKFEEFRVENRWKLEEAIKDMRSGARPIYCASLSDSNSIANNVFNQDWATENLGYFIQN